MDGHLQIEYNLGTKPVITQFEVNKIGNLIATYSDTKASIKVKNLAINKEGHLIATGDDMAKVDLGSVVGPQGPKGDTGAKGETGPKGDPGATGPQGPRGITPTFSLTNGHLYVDYDTPYTGT